MARKKMDTSAKERIKRIKVEEAANAVIWILEEHNKRFPNSTLKKALLLKRIPEAIWKVRSVKGGKYIPTVDNREVAIASTSFVNNNWTEICYQCAEFGYYVIWNPPGESLGLRLGTLEEYQRQQSQITAIASGIADYHNKRASIITSHGEQGNDLHVEVSKRGGL
ncbi:MAG TPA: hypothetical protein PKD55_02520 [Bellilinea sp.]|nr:hypothetical protein [Bellilinea sp.]